MKIRLLSMVAFSFLVLAPVTAAELNSFQRGSWEQIRTIYAGRPVIVHFWGLTCGPCRIEMPEWGKYLAGKAAIPLVVIHADPLPNNIALVNDMLSSAGLDRADNWVFDDSFKERLRREIDPAWRGELPRTLLIGGDGKIEVLMGSADMGVVTAWIAQQTKLQK